MDFNVKCGDPEKLRSACVVVGVSAPRRLSAAAERLDKASQGQLGELLKSGDIGTDCGNTTLIHSPRGGIQAKRILVVGCGKDKQLAPKAFIKIARAATAAVENSGAGDALSYLAELEVADRDLAWKARQTVTASRARAARPSPSRRSWCRTPRRGSRARRQARSRARR